MTDQLPKSPVQKPSQSLSLSSSQRPPRSRKTAAPGLLRLLPESLPFYPYNDSYHTKKEYNRRLHKGNKNNKDVEDLTTSGGIDATKFCPNEPLLHTKIMLNSTTNSSRNVIGGIEMKIEEAEEGFTLFFFVDSTNRQSLHAIPKVSHWFQHALMNSNENHCTGENNNILNNYTATTTSQVVCIPNHPSPNEINLSDTTSDPILQASINSSSISRQQQKVTGLQSKEQLLSMMVGTGFYHLPFLHPKRLPLLHLLGATRVPSVIVVGNKTGRIVTRYGWEGIDREQSILDDWSERMWIDTKRGDDGGAGSDEKFDSMLVKEWRRGRSGLPFWWHVLSWIL